MANKWFDEVFLPSLFNRYGVCNYNWITQKQTAICVKEMERSTIRIQFDSVQFGTHDNYTYIWGNREVWLSYSKKNGCGQISFRMTSEEEEQSREEIEKQESQAYLEKLKRRFKKRPEMVYKKIEELESCIHNMMHTLDGELVEDLEQYEIDMISAWESEIAAIKEVCEI